MPGIDNDAFFGPDPVPDRSWGPPRRVPDEAFYRAPPPRREAPFLVRTGARPGLFALIVFGFGFLTVLIEQIFAVFVDIWTIVATAPIFEELLKFGLALLLVVQPARRHAWLPLVDVPRILAAAGIGFAAGIPFGLTVQVVAAAGMAVFTLASRLAAYARRRLLHSAFAFIVALGVGAAFGIMEHSLPPYRDEPTLSYVWRISFHAVTPALSLACYHILFSARDVRLRWLSTVPATAVHFLNNAMAVVLGLILAGIGIPAIVGTVFQACIVALLVTTLVVVVAAPGATRRAAGRLGRHLPGGTPSGGRTASTPR